MLRFRSVFVFATVFISALWAQDKQFTDDWTKAANSPGSALTLKETGRNGVNGHTVVSYRLFASGLPKGQHFTLWTWNLGSAPQAVADAFINPEGLIVNRLRDATHKEDPIDVRAFAGRGERKRFAITSDDWTLQAFAEAVPFPIEQTANGCKLVGRNVCSELCRSNCSRFGVSAERIAHRRSSVWPGERQTTGECHPARHIHGGDSPSRERAKIGEVHCDDHKPEMQRGGSISLGRRQLQNPIADNCREIAIALIFKVCPFPRGLGFCGGLSVLSGVSVLQEGTSAGAQTTAPLPTNANLANQDQCRRQSPLRKFCCSDASFARGIRCSLATASSS